MPARINGDDIKAIFVTERTAADLQPYVTAANLIVDTNLLGAGYSDELLFEIERWLGAHLAATPEPLAAEEAAGDSRTKYQGATGMGLEATTYGQQVMVLDPKGILSSLKNMAAVGIVKSEALD